MLLELAHRAITEDEADVIITAGAPLAGLAHRVRDRIPVPMVEDLCASVKMAEARCALNPVTPTAGSFRRPARKPTSGLSRALSELIEKLEFKLACQNNYFGVLRDFGF
jgi:allantoin racemase